MTFEEAKAEILELAKQKNACKVGYKRAQRARTKNGLIRAIKLHILWCLQNKIATPENLERWFEVEALRKNHIYTSGSHVLIYNSAEVVAFVRKDPDHWITCRVEHPTRSFTITFDPRFAKKIEKYGENLKNERK